MSEASVPDQSESISDKLFAMAGSEPGDVDASNPDDDCYPPRLCRYYRQAALEWIGPVAFDRAYGAAPGVDHDFGMHWGSNRDKRISLRLNVGADTGLLHVYDPTWDEYAVLGNDVPRAAVEKALSRAGPLGEHPSVEDFVALLQNVPANRPPLGPEL